MKRTLFAICFVLSGLFLPPAFARAEESRFLFEVRGMDKILGYLDDKPAFQLKPRVWENDWAYRHPSHVDTDCDPEAERVKFEGEYRISDDGTTSSVPFRLSLEKKGKGNVSLGFSLEPSGPVSIEGVALELQLEENAWAGEKIVFEGEDGAVESVALPLFPTGEVLFEKTVGTTSFFSGGKKVFTIRPGRNVRATLIDRRIRAAGRVFALRLWTAEKRLEYGPNEFELSFEFETETSFSLDPAAPGNSLVADTWIEDPLPWDSFPVDLSFLNHKPAGKKGFVSVRDDRFLFEDSEEVRFWGVNLSANQCFPGRSEAEALARRLARTGVNLVRIHHINVKWADRRLLRFDEDGKLVVDPDAWLALDYLLFCLRNEGIYIQLDMLVDPDHIWPKPREIATWKGFSHFVPELLERQQKVARTIWEHRNPHTSLAYKDDPAIALCTIANENDITTHFQISRRGRHNVEPYVSMFEEMFEDWKKANGKSVFSNREDRREFNDQLQASYFKKMRDYMRRIGVRIPIAGTNWCFYQKDLPSMATMDYMDTHAYASGRLDAKPESGAAASAAAFARISGMPFVVSEYGPEWPDARRSAIPLLMASAGALQDWNGLVLYAYRQRGSGEATKLDGPYNLGLDPMTMGVMPAAALIFRRGDVRRAEKCYGIHWSPDMRYQERQFLAGHVPYYNTGVETHRLVAGIDRPPRDAQELRSPETAFARSGTETVASDTGELSRNFKDGIFVVDTERTKGVVGSFKNRKEIALGAFKLKIENEFAAVFLSSLDMKPLERSGKILVSAVGRAENDGATANLGGDLVLDEGRGPVMAEPVEGTISFGRSQNENARLFVLNKNGIAESDAMERVGKQVIVKLSHRERTLFYLIEN